MESLRELSSVYSSNTGRARRNLRGELERRTLTLNAQLLALLSGVNQVRI